MAASFRLLDCEAGQAANAMMGRVLIHWQARRPQLRDARALARALRVVRAGFPTAIGLLVAAEMMDGHLIPSAEARAAFSDFILEFDGVAGRVGAIVVLRDGFAGATIRSIATGILMAARRAETLAVFARSADAAALLLRALPAHLGDIPTADQLIDGLAVLRREVTAPPSRVSA